MNKREYLLACLGEELGECAQLVGKMLRFGVYDHHPKTGNTPNNELLGAELNDLLAVIELLREDGVDLRSFPSREAMNKKKDKVKKYMEYSKDKGLLVG